MFPNMYSFYLENQLSNRVCYLQGISKKTKWKRNRRVGRK